MPDDLKRRDESKGEIEKPSADLVVPKDSWRDAVYAITKAGVSVAASALAPWVGAPASELFGALVRTPVVKRTETFLTELAKKLADLETKVDAVSPASLASSEEFVSVLVGATRIAASTHEAAKHEALRNAVLNTAVRPDADSDLRSLFLRYVDELTPLHLRVLAFVHTLRSLPEDEWIAVLEREIPEIRGRRGLPALILKELDSRGLVFRLPGRQELAMRVPGPKSSAGRRSTGRGERVDIEAMPRSDTATIHIGDVGIAFLRYVSEPPELQSSTPPV